MIVDVLAAPADTPKIPVWLQILALALAPVLGFVGVAVGARLQSGAARAARLREDRRVTYLAFARTVHEFYQWFSLEGIKSADHRPGADLKRHMADSNELTSSINSQSYEVDLVASEKTAEAQRECVKDDSGESNHLGQSGDVSRLVRSKGLVPLLSRRECRPS